MSVMRSIGVVVVCLAALLPGARRAEAAPPPPKYIKPAVRVMALIDGKQGDAGRKAAQGRLTRLLARLGLPVDVRDVRNGLLSHEEMGDYRAVVTVFERDVPGHVGLLSWLDSEAKSGRKVLTLGGALMAAEPGSEQALEATVREALFPPRGLDGRLLVVVDPATSTGHRLEAQLGWVLDYGHLKADFVTPADLDRLRGADFHRYDAVVLGVELESSTAGGRAMADLARYVEQGGGLAVLLPPDLPSWRKLLGIASVAPGKPVRVKGLRYSAAFFAGMGDVTFLSSAADKEGDVYDEEVPRYVLASNAEPLIAAHDPKQPNVDVPIAWRAAAGQGRVLVRADSVLSDKEWRGHVLQTILMAMPVGVSPMVNALVFFIDDCPQPMWGQRLPPIDAEYGMTDTEFYRKVWWPDMVKLAEDFGLRYTLATIFSYDRRTDHGFSVTPFHDESSNGVPQWIGLEAIRLGHEVALHGYNHQSLVTSAAGYLSRGWKSREKMVEALRLARIEWERVFGKGNLPFSYVPPNNFIEWPGKQALKEVFPEIRVIAGQYVDDVPTESHDKPLKAEEVPIAGANFDRDPDEASFMNLPRVSSEYFQSQGSIPAIRDTLMLAGLWTHFVHPDDVFDNERSAGMGWAKLYGAAKKLVGDLRLAYPWLKGRTARDAYHALVRYRTTPFEFTRAPGELRVRIGGGTREPLPFMVRTADGSRVLGVQGGSVVYADKLSGVTIISGDAAEVVVKLGP